MSGQDVLAVDDSKAAEVRAGDRGPRMPAKLTEVLAAIDKRLSEKELEVMERPVLGAATAGPRYQAAQTARRDSEK